MYKKILVPMALDHDISPQTLRIASALKAQGGEITAVHVYETPQASVSAYLDEDTIRAGLDAAKKLLAQKIEGHTGVSGLVLKGHTARAIIDYANETEIDCIVIGSHKPGLRDYFLGSTAGRVVRHAQCAVHVHRSRP